MKLTAAAPAALAAALTLSACGGSTHTVTVQTVTVTHTATTPSGGSTGGTATTAAPPLATVHLSSFRTPTGNIGCMLIAGIARCDIVQRSWSPPPRPAGCPDIVDFGQGIEVAASGPARFVCAGDTSRDPTAPALAYGTRSLYGAFSCVSRTSGITCSSTTSGHGFTMSRGGYTLF